MPKNVVCKKCNNLVNDWCEKVIDSPDPDMQRDCKHFREKTNADRIRAMSDEKLVVFLDGFSGRCLDCAEDAKNKNCPIYKEGHYCRPQDIMEWLQQPAEVRHGRWEGDTEDIYRCSNCAEKSHVKEVMGHPEWDYCPNCGAKMDGCDGNSDMA